MPRLIAGFSAMALCLVLGAGAAGAQAAMKATAPKKMPSPVETRKMQDCERQAAQRNIKMDERAKFVMDCMTAKTK